MKKQNIWKLLLLTLIALVPLSTNAEGTAVNEQATATWTFDANSCGTPVEAAYSKSEYFKTSGFAIGKKDLSCSGIEYAQDTFKYTQPTTTYGTPYSKVKNLGTKLTSVNADAYVSFSLEPVQGLTFQPTKMTFRVTRCGTGSGNLKVVAYTGTGTETVLAAAITTIGRTRNGVGPFYTEFSYDISSIAASADATTLKIYIYNLDPNKELGFSDVTITGTMAGTIMDLTKDATVSSLKVAGRNVIVDQQAGTASIMLPKNIGALASYPVDFTIQEGAYANFTSGNSHNFAQGPLNLMVTAADSTTTKSYTISASVDTKPWVAVLWDSVTYAFPSGVKFDEALADYTVKKIYVAKGATTVPENINAFYQDYDLIVLHGSIDGQQKTALATKTMIGVKPILNLKAFLYQNNRWTWGTAENPVDSVRNISAIQEKGHPIFNGLTFAEGSNVLDCFASAPTSKNAIQFIKNFDLMDEATKAANHPLALEAGVGAPRTQMHEINLNSGAKFLGLFFSIEENSYSLWNDNLKTIIKNSAAYLLDPKQDYFKYTDLQVKYVYENEAQEVEFKDADTLTVEVGKYLVPDSLIKTVQIGETFYVIHPEYTKSIDVTKAGPNTLTLKFIKLDAVVSSVTILDQNFDGLSALPSGWTAGKVVTDNGSFAVNNDRLNLTGGGSGDRGKALSGIVGNAAINGTLYYEFDLAPNSPACRWIAYTVRDNTNNAIFTIGIGGTTGSTTNWGGGMYLVNKDKTLFTNTYTGNITAITETAAANTNAYLGSAFTLNKTYRVKVAMNFATKKLESFTITNKANSTETVTYENLDFLSTSAINCAKLDFVVTRPSGINSNIASIVDNLLIYKKTAVAGVRDVIIKYVDQDGVEFKQSRTVVGQNIDAVFNATAEDKVAFKGVDGYYSFNADSKTSIKVSPLENVLILQFTKAPLYASPFNWTGAASGVWNEAAKNFVSGTDTTAYQMGNAVVFGDAQSKSVSIVETMNLGDGDMNINAGGYSFTGAGSIDGTGKLIANLSAGQTVSLGVTNKLEKGTEINGGIVTVAKDGVLGDTVSLKGDAVLNSNLSLPALTFAGNAQVNMGAIGLNIAGLAATPVNNVKANAQIVSSVSKNVNTQSVTINPKGEFDGNITLEGTADDVLFLFGADPSKMMENAALNLKKTALGLNYTHAANTEITIGALSGDANAKLGWGRSSDLTASLTWVVGALNIDTEYAGQMVNAGGYKGSGSWYVGDKVNLKKVGTGTLTLSGTNANNGDYLVAQGALNVTGAIQGEKVAVVVDSAAVLSVSGKIAAKTTLNGILKPAKGQMTDVTITDKGGVSVKADTGVVILKADTLRINGGVLTIDSDKELVKGNIVKLFDVDSIIGQFAQVKYDAPKWNIEKLYTDGTIEYTYVAPLTLDAVEATAQNSLAKYDTAKWAYFTSWQTPTSDGKCGSVATTIKFATSTVADFYLTACDSVKINGNIAATRGVTVWADDIQVGSFDGIGSCTTKSFAINKTTGCKVSLKGFGSTAYVSMIEFYGAKVSNLPEPPSHDLIIKYVDQEGNSIMKSDTVRVESGVTYTVGNDKKEFLIGRNTYTVDLASPTSIVVDQDGLILTVTYDKMIQFFKDLSPLTSATNPYIIDYADVKEISTGAVESRWIKNSGFDYNKDNKSCGVDSTMRANSGTVYIELYVENCDSINFAGGFGADSRGFKVSMKKGQSEVFTDEKVMLGGASGNCLAHNYTVGCGAEGAVVRILRGSTDNKAAYLSQIQLYYTNPNGMQQTQNANVYAYFENDQLVIEELAEGEAYTILNTNGIVVAQGVSNGTTVRANVFGSNVYLIRLNGRTIKVIK